MAVNDDELTELAEEELASACAMPFVEIRKITPWGDTFTGFVRSGREVEVERRYIWADQPGGAVVVEVEVRDGPGRTGVEARRVLAQGA